MHASDGGNSGHEFTQEFWGVVGVQYIGGTTSKVEFVEQARYQGGGVAVREWDDHDSFGETVNEGQGFGFARSGETLSLKIHRVTGTGFGRGVRGK